MANGIMPGTGTREDPFIVEDGWDFNALRNIPATTAADVAFIELGADISLAMFPNFTPIPSRFFNIDGKGHKIRSVSLSMSGSSFGMDVALFSSLSCTEYIRNLTVEGMVSVRATGTGSGRVALLAANIRTAGISGSNVVIENIEAYGSVDVGSQGSSTTAMLAGGIVAQLNVESSNRATIRNCFFNGVAHCNMTNTATTSGPTLVFGGIAGRTDLSFNCTAAFDLCISDVGLFVAGTNGVRLGAFGGICGDCSGPTNSSAANRIVAFMSSIGKLTINFNNIGSFDRHLIFAGIMGRNDTSTASSGAAGMTTEIMNCGGFLTINFDPAISPMGVLDFNGLHGQGVRSASASSSYVVMEYNNPNGRERPETFNIRGLGSVTASANVFWDETVLRRTWSGEVAQPDRGRTTAQLQSQSFLESQGWVFANA